MKFKKLHLIIAAGGSGTRMGTAVPKQFVELRKTPLILLAAKSVAEVLPIHQIVVVSHKEYIEKTKEIFKPFSASVIVAEGGTERFHSIKNALAYLPSAKDEAILIHDAVRPFASPETIHAVLEECQKTGAAVPVVPLKESIRNISHRPSRMALRADFAIVQTPQCFRSDLIQKAYQQPFADFFTDDASVAEHAGFEIGIAPGNSENIKITEPSDLVLAEHYYDRFFK
ncbi:MAG: 2-C-methyl-D-erythritol 4-phosphate cytidylyltransferase [Bacteroidia bacterium]|nr:2-C-methyl-D-erythritol 4-phosphate cytidylyltransferase [Bacteroidia bacterium]